MILSRQVDVSQLLYTIIIVQENSLFDINPYNAELYLFKTWKQYLKSSSMS